MDCLSSVDFSEVKGRRFQGLYITDQSAKHLLLTRLFSRLFFWHHTYQLYWGFFFSHTVQFWIVKCITWTCLISQPESKTWLGNSADAPTVGLYTRDQRGFQIIKACRFCPLCDSWGHCIRLCNAQRINGQLGLGLSLLFICLQRQIFFWLF